MSEWWERAYPGGKMVGPPLVRPLYPPDASSQGKKPSPPGLDVQGIKRTVSRLGRWPWQTFDDSFSNAFAHGKSGNVGETGLAGFQRQMGVIPSTGWLGEYTYNALRSARIPDGLPHAGEPGMDAYAVDLLERAAQSLERGTVREQALAKAIAQLGYVESPPGTNGTMFGAWYGMNYEPWCAMFCAWAFEHAGGSPSFAAGHRYAYVPYIVSDARNHLYGLSVTGSPIPGDLVCYDWHGDGVHDHVGLFESGSASSFKAIEGNTSPSNDSNGGQVMRRSRSGGAGVVFVRVAEP